MDKLLIIEINLANYYCEEENERKDKMKIL
jgi:hypothetical protein